MHLKDKEITILLLIITMILNFLNDYTILINTNKGHLGMHIFSGISSLPMCWNKVQQIITIKLRGCSSLVFWYFIFSIWWDPDLGISLGISFEITLGKKKINLLKMFSQKSKTWAKLFLGRLINNPKQYFYVPCQSSVWRWESQDKSRSCFWYSSSGQPLN